MRKQIIIAVVLGFAFIPAGFAQRTALEVSGSISNVIVYRGQALITRTIELDLSKGRSEVIVTGLPNKIISESLYGRARDNVTVSSVRYRERAVKEDTREEVKQLDAEIKQVQTRLRHAEANRDLFNKNMITLGKLQDFTITAQNNDLNRGLLQFEPLKELVTLIETKRSEYHNEALKIDDRIIELKEQMELLQRKRQELKAGRSRTQREAVILVDSGVARKAVIYLNYLVSDANWLPQYNLRARPDESKVEVEYNSVIHQASGEDWTNTALFLSTAQPAMEAAAPVLEPMKVRLSPEAVLYEKERPGEPSVQFQQKAHYRNLSDEFRNLQSSRRRIAGKGKAAQRELDRLAIDNQMMELQADKRAFEVIKKEARKFARTEGVSVTYDLGKGFSMPSRSDQQLVTIAVFETDADFIRLGTPLLTDYVYLQAEVVNDSNVILLAGPASTYRNGEFVGKSRLDLITIGQKFTAGFGVDSQIQISREFKDKKVDTLWGNRVEKYEYRIAIENYKNTDIKLRMLERIPYTEDEKLEIRGFETNTPLSKDAEYIRVLRDKGVLRWDLVLKPGTIDDKAAIVTYGYTMKYDNDMQIQAVPLGR